MPVVRCSLCKFGYSDGIDAKPGFCPMRPDVGRNNYGRNCDDFRPAPNYRARLKRYAEHRAAKRARILRSAMAKVSPSNSGEPIEATTKTRYSLRLPIKLVEPWFDEIVYLKGESTLEIRLREDTPLEVIQAATRAIKMGL